MLNFFPLFPGIMDPSLMVTGGAGKADLPFINDLKQMELNPALFMSSILLKHPRYVTLSKFYFLVLLSENNSGIAADLLCCQFILCL